MDESEKDIIIRVQKGDSASFELLITKYKYKVYGMLRVMIKNESDVEDLIQQVFIKVYRNIHKFQFKSSFYTWLYRIAVNQSIDFIRKNKKVSKISLSANDENIEFLMEKKPNNTESPAFKNEVKAIIKNGIKQLDPLHRVILQMREVEGLDYKEIATTLKINAGTVMSRLFNARKKLKEKLLPLLKE